MLYPEGGTTTQKIVVVVVVLSLLFHQHMVSGRCTGMSSQGNVARGGWLNVSISTSNEV